MTNRAQLTGRLRGFVVVLVRRSARLRLAQTAASLAFLSLLAIVLVVVSAATSPSTWVTAGPTSMRGSTSPVGRITCSTISVPARSSS